MDTVAVRPGAGPRFSSATTRRSTASGAPVSRSRLNGRLRSVRPAATLTARLQPAIRQADHDHGGRQSLPLASAARSASARFSAMAPGAVGRGRQVELRAGPLDRGARAIGARRRRAATAGSAALRDRQRPGRPRPVCHGPLVLDASRSGLNSRSWRSGRASAEGRAGGQVGRDRARMNTKAPTGSGPSRCVAGGRTALARPGSTASSPSASAGQRVTDSGARPDQHQTSKVKTSTMRTAWRGPPPRVPRSSSPSW